MDNHVFTNDLICFKGQQQLDQIDLGFQQQTQAGAIGELQTATEHIQESQTVHHVPISETGEEQTHQHQSALIATSLPSTSIASILHTK